MAALLAFVMLLSACERNVATGDSSSSTVSKPVAASVKTGLATVNSMAISDDAVTAKTVVAAVSVGDGGKITACRIDELETDAKLKDGKISREKDGFLSCPVLSIVIKLPLMFSFRGQGGYNEKDRL